MSIASDIILERLKTHPEEFVKLDGDIIHGTWSPLINNASRWATEEEIKAIDEAMIEARKLIANEIAMKILSGEYYTTEPLEPLAYQHPYNSSTLTLDTSQKMSEIQLRRMMEIQKEYDKLQQGATITLTGKAK